MFAGVGKLFADAFAKYVVGKLYKTAAYYIAAFINYIGRKAADEKQKQTDNEQSKDYKEVIEKGSKDEIIRKTEDMFNS